MRTFVILSRYVRTSRRESKWRKRMIVKVLLFAYDIGKQDGMGAVDIIGEVEGRL